jgi:hypothetical protein
MAVPDDDLMDGSLHAVLRWSELALLDAAFDE